MYVFGVFALLGLGVYALAMFFERMMVTFQELWAIVVVALGVGLAWIADLNIFALWGIELRAEWIGITLTGLMLGGIAYFWRESLGLVASLFRKVSDEAETLERTHNLRRVA